MMEKEAKLLARSDAEEQRLHAKENELDNKHEIIQAELREKDEKITLDLEHNRNALNEEKAKLLKENLEKADELRQKESSLLHEVESERNKLARRSVELNEENEGVRVRSENNIALMREELEKAKLAVGRLTEERQVLAAERRALVKLKDDIESNSDDPKVGLLASLTTKIVDTEAHLMTVGGKLQAEETRLNTVKEEVIDEQAVTYT